MLDAIKYFDYLKIQYFQDHEARWNNVGELMSIARKQPSAEEDLNEYTLSSDEEENTEPSDGILESNNMIDLTVEE